MRLDAFDVRHKTDTAGVMLAGRRIQTSFLKMLDLSCGRHGAFLLKNHSHGGYRNATKVPRKINGVRF
jgi:hypothetical protein